MERSGHWHSQGCLTCRAANVVDRSASTLLRNYQYMAQPLAHWLQASTPRQKQQCTQLHIERLQWVGIFEHVQRLYDMIVSRQPSLNEHLLAELRARHDELLRQWRLLSVQESVPLVVHATRAANLNDYISQNEVSNEHGDDNDEDDWTQFSEASSPLQSTSSARARASTAPSAVFAVQSVQATGSSASPDESCAVCGGQQQGDGEDAARFEFDLAGMRQWHINLPDLPSFNVCHKCRQKLQSLQPPKLSEVKSLAHDLVNDTHQVIKIEGPNLTFPRIALHNRLPSIEYDVSLRTYPPGWRSRNVTHDAARGKLIVRPRRQRKAKSQPPRPVRVSSSGSGSSQLRRRRSAKAGSGKRVTIVEPADHIRHSRRQWQLKGGAQTSATQVDAEQIWLEQQHYLRRQEELIEKHQKAAEAQHHKSEAIANLLQPIEHEQVRTQQQTAELKWQLQNELESSMKSDEDFYWRYWHSNDGKTWHLWVTPNGEQLLQQVEQQPSSAQTSAEPVPFEEEWKRVEEEADRSQSSTSEHRALRQLDMAVNEELKHMLTGEEDEVIYAVRTSPPRAAGETVTTAAENERRTREQEESRKREEQRKQREAEWKQKEEQQRLQQEMEAKRQEAQKRDREAEIKRKQQQIRDQEANIKRQEQQAALQETQIKELQKENPQQEEAERKRKQEQLELKRKQEQQRQQKEMELRKQEAQKADETRKHEAEIKRKQLQIRDQEANIKRQEQQAALQETQIKEIQREKQQQEEAERKRKQEEVELKRKQDQERKQKELELRKQEAQKADETRKHEAEIKRKQQQIRDQEANIKRQDQQAALQETQIKEIRRENQQQEEGERKRKLQEEAELKRKQDQERKQKELELRKQEAQEADLAKRHEEEAAAGARRRELEHEEQEFRQRQALLLKRRQDEAERLKLQELRERELMEAISAHSSELAAHLQPPVKTYEIHNGEDLTSSTSGSAQAAGGKTPKAISGLVAKMVNLFEEGKQVDDDSDSQYWRQVEAERQRWELEESRQWEDEQEKRAQKRLKLEQQKQREHEERLKRKWDAEEKERKEEAQLRSERERRKQMHALEQLKQENAIAVQRMLERQSEQSEEHALETGKTSKQHQQEEDKRQTERERLKEEKAIAQQRIRDRQEEQSKTQADDTEQNNKHRQQEENDATEKLASKEIETALTDIDEHDELTKDSQTTSPLTVKTHFDKSNEKPKEDAEQVLMREKKPQPQTRQSGLMPHRRDQGIIGDFGSDESLMKVMSDGESFDLDTKSRSRPISLLLDPDTDFITKRRRSEPPDYRRIDPAALCKHGKKVADCCKQVLKETLGIDDSDEAEKIAKKDKKLNHKYARITFDGTSSSQIGPTSPRTSDFGSSSGLLPEPEAEPEKLKATTPPVDYSKSDDDESPTTKDPDTRTKTPEDPRSPVSSSQAQQPPQLPSPGTPNADLLATIVRRRSRNRSADNDSLLSYTDSLLQRNGRQSSARVSRDLSHKYAKITHKPGGHPEDPMAVKAKTLPKPTTPGSPARVRFESPVSALIKTASTASSSTNETSASDRPDVVLISGRGAVKSPTTQSSSDDEAPPPSAAPVQIVQHVQVQTRFAPKTAFLASCHKHSRAIWRQRAITDYDGEPIELTVKLPISPPATDGGSGGVAVGSKSLDGQMHMQTAEHNICTRQTPTRQSKHVTDTIATVTFGRIGKPTDNSAVDLDLPAASSSRPSQPAARLIRRQSSSTSGASVSLLRFGSFNNGALNGKGRKRRRTLEMIIMQLIADEASRLEKGQLLTELEKRRYKALRCELNFRQSILDTDALSSSSDTALKEMNIVADEQDTDIEAPSLTSEVAFEKSASRQSPARVSFNLMSSNNEVARAQPRDQLRGVDKSELRFKDKLRLFSGEPSRRGHRSSSVQRKIERQLSMTTSTSNNSS